jgi:hypothetical protein
MSNDANASIEAAINAELAKSLVREFMKAKRRLYKIDDRISAKLIWSASEDGTMGPGVQVTRWGRQVCVRLPVEAVEDEILDVVLTTANQIDHVVIPEWAEELRERQAAESRGKASPAAVEPPKPANGRESAHS